MLVEGPLQSHTHTPKHCVWGWVGEVLLSALATMLLLQVCQSQAAVPVWG